MRVVKPFPLGKCLFVRAREVGAVVGRPLVRSIRLTALCALMTTFRYGCASETPIELPVVGPVAGQVVTGRWTMRAVILCRHNSMRLSARSSGPPTAGCGQRGAALGVCPCDLDTLIALAKIAELVTDSDLLEIEQDPHILRVDEQIILR